jgi:hypothetical protein
MSDRPASGERDGDSRGRCVDSALRPRHCLISSKLGTDRGRGGAAGRESPDGEFSAGDGRISSGDADASSCSKTKLAPDPSAASNQGRARCRRWLRERERNPTGTASRYSRTIVKAFEVSDNPVALRSARMFAGLSELVS